MLLFDTYDIVFAGGGTAACIIAGRLAQADSSLKILVIEAGPHSFNLHNHVQPARYLNSLVQGHTVTLHNSVHSEALGGRSVSIPSGCCVGGGSAVNFMIYTRAAASDYDDWEKLGNSGWGSRSLIPLARKVETYQLPSDSPSVHGSTGPIKVSHGGHDTNIGKEFLTAAQYDKDRKSSPSADINDFQTTNVYGVSLRPRYIDSDTGKRSDVAHHFLYNLPNFSLDPNEGNNLHVLTNRRVVKVIFKDNRAIGVEYIAHEDLNVESRLPPRIAYASRLVVLSSGAFGSPAILERSGIGSARYLTDADIRQIVDLPGVGENYNDHTLCVTPYLASEDSDCLDDIFSGDEEAIKPHLKEWQEEGSGLLAHNSVDAGVKLRPTPEELEELGPSFRKIWQEFYVGAPDKPVACLVPTAGLEHFPRSIWKTIYSKAYPRATGYTHISSPTNPWAPLRFDPKFLEDPADLSVLRWCYKHARELARRMKSFRGEIPARHPKFCSNSSVSVPSASGPFPIDSPKIVYSKEDDRAIDEYIRATVGTTWHSLGTCAMKPREAGGVVDSRLNVYGVENLKIADMSIAPLNVGANTNNTALVIGEKAFLLIAEDLGISLESEKISHTLKNLSLCAHLNGK
ncbi:GMC oxidoreductase-domain-containing protein [Lentinula edodes]|uniref:GMC oxidoreductase-domain-containing protein n=1 Tax=Lentinula lateritia TaxID=40482 RepID=A0A9W8ZSA4_9AGAR|nr:GMC oxidoreductase-domain-containing protein [Lentinula edodes]